MCGVLVGVVLLGVLCGETRVSGIATASTGPFQVVLDVPEVIFDGQQIRFNCSAEEEVGVANITWWLDGAQLQGGPDGQLVHTVTLPLNGSCLTCMVERNDSSAANASSILTVASTSPTLVEYPMSQTVSRGDPLVLVCTVLGLPTPTVCWKRNGVIQGNPFGSLGSAVLNISAVDHENAGNYTCTATIGSNTVSTFPVVVIRVTSAPEILTAPEDVDVLKNTALMLACVAQGDPLPTISWEHNGRGVDTNDARITILDSGNLTITMVMLTDMGFYQCIATNALGSDESDTVMVTVLVFPSFSLMPSATTVDLDDPVGLECVASGIPDVDYAWFRLEARGLVRVVLNDRVMANNGSLNITMATRQDAGNYVCVVSNELANITSTAAQLTVRAVPLPPGNLRDTSQGSSWVVMEWNSETSAAINRYTLEYKLTFEADSAWMAVHIESPPDTFQNVTALYPSATYQFRVRARSFVGEGEVSDVVEAITTPGAPVAGLVDMAQQVEVEGVSPESLNVSWSVPQVLQQTSYISTLLTVQNVSGDDVLSVTTSSPSSLLPGLSPATNYSINITLMFRGGHLGTPVTLQATTMDGVPGDAPTQITSVPLGPESVRVTWAPPRQPNGQILNYTIYYSPSSFNVTVMGGATSQDLDMLVPFTRYSIRLSASTSAGEGPLSLEEVTVRTEQDVPPAPSGVSLTPLDSTAIQVVWEAFASGTVPGILVNFTISYNRRHHGGHPTVVSASPNDTGVELGGLLPFTEYCVRVAAATEAGLGDFTQKTTTRTFGDVPGAAVEGVVVSEVCPVGGLLVIWCPPNSRLLGGPVEDVQYMLSYSAEGGGFRGNSTFSYNASLSRYPLEDIEPFTNYTVQLALQNRNGTGQSGNASGTSCDDAAPPPIDIVAQATSSSTVEVSWRAPPTIPGVLISYVLRYEGGGVTNDVNISAVNTSGYVIRDLIPFTNYSVGVATQTRGPLGPFSAVMLVLTLSAVPNEAVVGVSVQPACPSNLLVQWEAPQRLRAPAIQTHYLVSYNSTTGDVGELIVPYTEGPTANLTSLQLDTVYSVSVTVVNDHGPGPSTTPLAVRTMLQGVAMAPSNVMVETINSSALRVMWTAASAPMPEYLVHYHPTSTANLSQLAMWPNTSPPPLSPPSVELGSLQPFTEYSIIVMATRDCGSNQSAVITGITGESLPTIPLDFVVTAALPTRVKVQWSPPDLPNGNVTHYNVYCPLSNVSATVVSGNMSYTHKCDGLQTATPYNISVSAENGAGEGPAAFASATTTCTPTIEEGKGRGMVNIRLSESCFTRVTAYILVVVQELVCSNAGCDPPALVEEFGLELLLERTEQYQRRLRRRQPNDGGGVYIAANLTMAELSDFALGDSRDYGEFTNHALVPGSFYNVVLRGTVPGTDTAIFYTSEEQISGGEVRAESTEADSSLPLIPIAAGAGAALLIILLICMATLISCICCCCNRSLDKVDGVTGIRIERTGSFRLSKKKLLDPVEDFRANSKTEVLEDHPPVPVMGFINKLMVMRTNDNQLFLEEFGSIPMTMPHLSTDVANLHVNKVRNRYNNILPYDVTRVKLRNGDYINANYCSGHRKTKAYIATQGPLKETLADFWRMVWEENVRTVVMLTNVQEKGKIKCEMYWPREVGSSVQHGQLDVSLASVITLADYSIRKFAISKGSSSKEPREVVQFHFTSWPDHGVPQYATAMLAMLRRVRAHYSLEEGPMLVHCSAGVGRTGTFIVIDTMLQRLMHEDEMLDIYGHVSLLRSQRNYMIQTEDQYFFVHEAIAEALLCGNTEVALESLPGYVENLYSVIPDDESETTNLELQFKRLALERTDPHRWMTANKDANKTKNRFVNVLPYDSSRVCLEYSPGVDGSDYINASHVDSYHKRRAFIATQGPLTSTVKDFWRMLWQYSAPVVVMLTEEVEKGRECSAGYWPGAILHPVSYGKLSVELNVERNSGSYSYRDLCVTKDNEKRLVRQFQFHGWPEVGVPSPAVLIEFIREVQKLCQTLPPSNGPIVVHCSNGVGRTGVFLALHIVLERMMVEGLVDVFQTVKNLRIQRPAMVQTLEQYHLCYDSAVTYLQSSEFLPPLPQQPLLTRQRSSSKRGSRHGSHSSADSRKKSKTVSPSLSPARSLSQRNTPMRSDSFKESPRGTMELVGTGGGAGGGGAQVYGGSDATSTFGSRPLDAPVESTSSQPAMQVHSDGLGHVQHHTLATASSPASTGLALPGSNTPQLTAASATAYGYGAPVLPASAPNVAMNGSHTPVMASGPNVATPNGSHTPVLYTPAPSGSNTPVPAYGPHTPVLAGPHTSTANPAAAYTPATVAPPNHLLATPHALAAVNGPTVLVPGPSPNSAGCQSQSPIPAGLDMTPQVFAGSQSSVFTGSGFGSQTLSLFSGSQTPPMSHMSLSPNSQNGPPPHVNTHHYHQLLETQRHAPNNSLPDRAVGADSTPL